MDYARTLELQEATTLIAKAAKFGFRTNNVKSFCVVVQEAIDYLVENTSPSYSTLCQHPKVGDLVLDREFKRTVCVSAYKDGDTTGLGIHLESAQLVRYYFSQP